MTIREYLNDLFDTDYLVKGLIYRINNFEIEISYINENGISFFITHNTTVRSFIFDLSWDVSRFFSKKTEWDIFDIFERNYRIDQFLK